MEKPNNGKNMNVPTSETGTASSGISVARQPCRKMIDHQDHQRERDQEGLDDFLDALGDRACCVECHDVVHVLREALLHLSHQLADARGRLHRIRSGQLIHGDDRAGLSVQTADDAVVLRAQFDARHVLHPHHAAVRRFAHARSARILPATSAGLARDGVGKFLSLGRGLAAHLPGRIHGVLRLDGADDLGNGDAQFRQLVRLDPQPHRVLARAEYLHVADARHARKWIVEIDDTRSSPEIWRRRCRSASTRPSSISGARHRLSHRHSIIVDVGGKLRSGLRRRATG